MVGTFLEEVVISPGQHVAFRVLTENSYEVHIKAEPSCSCPDFQKRDTMHKCFVACKHMYFVYVHILGLQPKEHMAMHQPTLSIMDITFILGQQRNILPAV